MKSYENKKFYNFKEVHKRKKRTRSAQKWWKSGSHHYLKLKRREYRTKCKIVLRKKIKGENIEFPVHKKTPWWDS